MLPFATNLRRLILTFHVNLVLMHQGLAPKNPLPGITEGVRIPADQVESSTSTADLEPSGLAARTGTAPLERCPKAKSHFQRVKPGLSTSIVNKR